MSRRSSRAGKKPENYQEVSEEDHSDGSQYDKENDADEPKAKPAKKSVNKPVANVAAPRGNFSAVALFGMIIDRHFVDATDSPIFILLST
jgi:hypothetical protein